MRQPKKKTKGKNTPQKKIKIYDARGKVVRDHPKFGTSKLEKDFARDFLDKLGVKYKWQFEAKDIGRFYDFFIEPSGPIIEVDGGYWHSDPRVIKENELTPTQKKNKRVDKIKDEWALLHGIPIYRIWELDIRQSPQKVMEELREILNKPVEKPKRRRKLLKS